MNEMESAWVSKAQGPARNTWTLENLARAAGECRTRLEFKRRYAGGYNTAGRLGVMDTVCSHMSSRYESWTDEALILEASRFPSRAAFREGSPNAYAATIRRRKMAMVSAHFQEPTTGLGNHLVYRLSFRTCVYIGLTCTPDSRSKYHSERGCVARHPKATGERLPPMEVWTSSWNP